MKYLDIKLPDIYLRPCEIYFTDKPALVSTVLGSCISVTMFNASSGTSAICHGMLPQCRTNEVHSCGNMKCSELHKYVDCSIRIMINKMKASGIKRSDIEVKIFGGSEMVAVKRRTSDWKTVGQENIMTATSLIYKEKLNLVSYDVGGTAGRKILFNTKTGEVFMKRVNNISDIKRQSKMESKMNINCKTRRRVVNE